MSVSGLIDYIGNNPLSIIALLFGVAGVWLTILQNIWCWPVSLVSVVTSGYEFYAQRLYGDMSLQAVYLVAGIYGWIYWKRKETAEFKIQRLTSSSLPYYLLATSIQTVIYFLMLKHWNGDRPLFDAILTAASLTATYMMTKKLLENWLAWVLIDGTYIILYGLKAMWPFAVLYLLFTLMAFKGWLKWRKAL